MQIYGCAIFRTFFGEKAHAKQTPNPNPLSRSNEGHSGIKVSSPSSQKTTRDIPIYVWLQRKHIHIETIQVFVLTAIPLLLISLSFHADLWLCHLPNIFW